MALTPSTNPRLLVVVEAGGDPHRAAEYALRSARDAAAERDAPVALDVLVIADAAAEPALVDETVAELESALAPLRRAQGTETIVEHRRLTGDRESSRTNALLHDLAGQSVTRLLVPSNTTLDVPRLRGALGATTVELVATAEADTRRRLLHPGGYRRLTVVFGLTYLFYLAIGGFSGGFDLLTGAISAGVVAVSLGRVALRDEPTLPRSGRRLGRTVLFLPVLLWEVVKANVVIAAIILHPRLPISPSVDTLETETWTGLERMVLANSVTLTPGTLVVDVQDATFTVHSLTADARADLEGGRLERLVSWVFHGRRDQGDDAGADTGVDRGGTQR